MFVNLWDYARQRNSIEATIFYLGHFVMGVMIAGVVAGVIGLATGRSHDQNFGVQIGSVVAVIFSLIISFVIVYKKHSLNNLLPLIFISLSGVLAWFGGVLLGLIPCVYLSLQQGKIHKENKATSGLPTTATV